MNPASQVDMDLAWMVKSGSAKWPANHSEGSGHVTARPHYLRSRLVCETSRLYSVLSCLRLSDTRQPSDHSLAIRTLYSQVYSAHIAKPDLPYHSELYGDFEPLLAGD